MLLVPVAIRQIHSMQSLQMHAPEMKAIQQRYKCDRQKQSEELMKFYKENKINPYASCLPIVFQIPIFIALFFVLRDFEDEVYPKFAETTLEWLNLINITEPTKDGLGPVLLVIYVVEPAHVDVAHVDVDAERSAALDDHAAPDRLHPVHPQLPVRADDLLADDEPLDDGARAHHPAADASARSRLRSGRAGRRRRKTRLRQRIEPAVDGAGAALPPFAPARRAVSSGRRAAGESGERATTDVRVEASGETVGEAKWSALRELEQLVPGLDREQVEFEVVSEGERGLLGRRIHARPRRREGFRAEARRDAVSTGNASDAREFVDRIAEAIGADVTVSAGERDGVVTVTCSGEDLGLFIGKHGQTIDAIQYLANAVARAEGGEHEIVVDAAGYRARRNASPRGGREPLGAPGGDDAEARSSSTR